MQTINSIGKKTEFRTRPVNRKIQKQVLNELSKGILNGTIVKFQNVVLETFDREIIFRIPILETVI